MKKLVIFDLDGTLLDTRRDLTECMNAMLDKFNMPKIDDEKTRRYIGYGARRFVEQSIGEKNSAMTDECLACYNKIYELSAYDNTSIYPGIGKLLTELKRRGVKTAIVSNKPQEAVNAIYKKFLSEYSFDYIYGHRDGDAHKPDPTCVNAVLNAVGADKADTVYVGDSEVDVETANNAGIDCVSVLWGYRDKATLSAAGADCYAKNSTQLKNRILYYFGRHHMKKFFNEFKTFISRGNVLDMAVGVIIGAAFSAIVNSLVKDIITPLISLLTGGISLDKLNLILRPAVLAEDGVTVVKAALTFNYGSFIQSIINFLIIAWTVFLFVKAAIGVKKSLDYNDNMKNVVQKKLDADEKLTSIESKWLARKLKKDPADAPKKTAPKTAAPAAAAAAPTATELLLKDILAELKAANADKTPDEKTAK